MQTALFRICTQVAKSSFYNDNRLAMRTSNILMNQTPYEEL